MNTDNLRVGFVLFLAALSIIAMVRFVWYPTIAGMIYLTKRERNKVKNCTTIRRARMLSRFSDMRRRVLNASPCDVEYLPRKPGCWDYGTLFIFPNDSGGCSVAFGDLVVPIIATELVELCVIARSRTGREG